MGLLEDALQIKNETQEGANTALRVGGLLEEILGITGGADYIDTQYTSANPFTLSSGVKTTIPNNAGSTYKEQMPTYFTDFYDVNTNKFLGRNGDFWALEIEMKARPTSNATSVRLDIAIDIGGAVGEIYPDNKILNRGNNVEHPILFSFPVIFNRETFETNGGLPRITAVNSDVEIYDIRFVFANHHRAR